MSVSRTEEVYNVLSVLYGLVSDTAVCQVAGRADAASRNASIRDKHSLQAPLPNPNAHQQAVVWLLEFQDTQEAWGVFVELLYSSNENVIQYYAANSLHAKLWSILASCCERCQPPTIRRICLALATCVLLSKGAGSVDALVQKLTAILASEASETTVLAAVEVLRALPDELETQHITGLPRERLLREMTVASDAILTMFATMVMSDMVRDSALASSILAAVAGWSAACDISVEELAYKVPALLEFCVASLGGDATTSRHSSMTLETLVEHTKPALRDHRVAALHKILEQIVVLHASTAMTLQTAQNALRVMIAISQQDAAWLVGEAASIPLSAVYERAIPTHLLDGVAEMPALGLSTLIAEIALQLAGTSSVEVFEDALDFFLPIHNVPTADRHPFFRAFVFKWVLQVTVGRIAVPVSGEWSVEDFTKLRGRNSFILDPLSDCFSLLEAQYVTVLVNNLLAVHTGLTEQLITATHVSAADGRLQALELLVTGTAIPGIATWQVLEATLHCLTAVSRDLCELLEDADLDVANGDASTVEYITALLHIVSTATAAKMPQELATTSARFLGSLGAWVSFTVQSGMATIRCSTAFHTGVAAEVDAAIIMLKPSDVMANVIDFLTSCMRLPAREPVRDSLVSVVIHLGLGTGKGSVYGEVDDGNDDDGMELQTAAALSTSVAAAQALATYLRSCRLALVDPLVLTAISDALSAAVASSGVSIQQRCTLTINLLETAAHLPAAARGDTYHYIVGPIMQELQDLQEYTASTINAESSLRLCQCLALLISALRSTAAEGVTDDSSSLAPQVRCPLHFIVDRGWPIVEQLLSRHHEVEEVVACCFAFLEKCIRVAWDACSAGLASLFDLATKLFQFHLYASPLQFIDTALTTWSMEFRQAGSAHEARLPPEAKDFVHNMLSQVTRAAALSLKLVAPEVGETVPVGSFDANCDAATALCDLYRRVADIEPIIIFGDDILPGVFQFMGSVVLLWDRQAAKSTSLLMQTLLTRPDFKAVFEENINRVVAAHGQSLMTNIFAALLDDRCSSTVVTSIIDILRLFLESFGDQLQGAAEVMMTTLDGYALKAQQEDAEKLEIPLEDVPRYVETGMSCLTAEDRQGLIRLAITFARDDTKRFRMLIDDLTKLAKRSTMKDALLSYLIAQEFAGRGRRGRRGSDTPRVSFSLG